MIKVLVTGSTGFVGRALVPELQRRNFGVVEAVRRAVSAQQVAVGDISGDTDWTAALAGVDAVVHLAARVHDMQGVAGAEAYTRTNVDATLALAQASSRAGVKRFIFISSVKAMGEGQAAPYTEKDIPQPLDDYGISKWQAEQALREPQLGEMEVVILRPPLIYGPGVGANFLRLMALMEKQLPLPFGALNNCRSMLYVENFVDAIIHCLAHPNAGQKTLLVSDMPMITMAEFLRLLAKSMQRRSYLLPVPAGILTALGKIMSKEKVLGRITGTLAVDSSYIRTELGWQQPYTTDEGLRQTAEWYSRSGP